MIVSEQQNKWFKACGLKLVRITDKQLEIYKKSESSSRLRTLFVDMIAK